GRRHPTAPPYRAVRVEPGDPVPADLGHHQGSIPGGKGSVGQRVLQRRIVPAATPAQHADHAAGGTAEVEEPAVVDICEPHGAVGGRDRIIWIAELPEAVAPAQVGADLPDPR